MRTALRRPASAVALSLRSGLEWRDSLSYASRRTSGTGRPAKAGPQCRLLCPTRSGAPLNRYRSPGAVQGELELGVLRRPDPQTRVAPARTSSATRSILTSRKTGPTAPTPSLSQSCCSSRDPQLPSCIAGSLLPGRPRPFPRGARPGTAHPPYRPSGLVPQLAPTIPQGARGPQPQSLFSFASYCLLASKLQSIRLVNIGSLSVFGQPSNR